MSGGHLMSSDMRYGLIDSGMRDEGKGGGVTIDGCVMLVEPCVLHASTDARDAWPCVRMSLRDA